MSCRKSTSQAIKNTSSIIFSSFILYKKSIKFTNKQKYTKSTIDWKYDYTVRNASSPEVAPPS